MAASVALASESCRASAASGYHDLHLHLQRLQLDLKARVQTVDGEHCNYLPAGFLPGPQAPPALLPPDPIPGMTQRRRREVPNKIGLRLQVVYLGLQGRIGSLMSSRMWQGIV